MLRILSSKIFREDLSDYALPMWAFEDFEDVEKFVDGDTYKFCLPVSIGDFPETNVPACFSNDVEQLREFVQTQKEKNHRKAFIISDFQVNNLDNICYSGVISTSSQKGMCDYFDKQTTISITLKNPILTYGLEGISPRDLPSDVLLTYDHVSNANCAFPRIDVQTAVFDLEKYKEIIYQAYLASTKIHEVSEMYDGEEYNEHTLFFVNDKNRIQLYEIVGEESFVGHANFDSRMVRDELDLVKLLSTQSDEVESEKPKVYTKK